MSVAGKRWLIGGVFLLTGAVSGWAADATDEQFIKDAIQGNLAEVDIGQLAQQKGATPEVRDCGAMLVKDHQEDIAKYHQEAQLSSAAGNDAKAILPKLHLHLTMAQGLESATTSKAN